MINIDNENVKTRLKYLSDMYTGNSMNADLKEKYSTNTYGICYVSTKDIDANHNINYNSGIKVDNEMYKIAPVDSILLCIEGGSAGKKVASLNQEVAFVNKLCCFVPNNLIKNRFLYFFILSTYFESQFQINTSGLIGGVSVTALKNFDIILPSLIKQNQITNYLDNRISSIDKIINDKQNLIEKLKEYRQAIINEAVTKGLDRNATMKDSGVDWISEIPKGWNINKFKYLFTFSRGLNITKADLIEDGIPCVNYGEIHSKFGFEINPAFNSLMFIDKNYTESSPKSILARGDFVFADTSEDIEGSGNFTCLDSDIPTFAGYHTIVARQKENHNYRYLSYLFESSKYRNQIRSSVYGVKVYSITQNILKNTMVLLPPKKEQEQIACFLDKSRNKINSIINSAEQQINKLQEYKKSIISEAVTGKIKVD